MNFRNPYDSILVLKALIQEIMYQVSKAYNPEELNIVSYKAVQEAVDELVHRVEFRGTPLHKLLSIELRQKYAPQDKPIVDFVLRPLSEDGRVYLKLLQMEDAPAFPLAQADITKVQIRRIVEI